VRVKGLDNDCRHFLVQAGAVETRVIEIGPDGKSVGQSFAIPTEFIYDPEDAEHSGAERTTISDRGEVVIPARQRAAKDVNGRWNVDVELTAEGWLIRPIGPAE
jgi:hypothetical protein